MSGSGKDQKVGKRVGNKAGSPVGRQDDLMAIAVLKSLGPKSKEMLALDEYERNA